MKELYSSNCWDLKIKNTIEDAQLRKLILKIYLSTLTLFFGSSLFGQSAPALLDKKINLEDVKIKGEVNQGQNLLGRRTQLNLDSRIKIPTNFRREILENLDTELNGISQLDSKK